MLASANHTGYKDNWHLYELNVSYAPNFELLNLLWHNLTKSSLTYNIPKKLKVSLCGVLGSTSTYVNISTYVKAEVLTLIYNSFVCRTCFFNSCLPTDCLQLLLLQCVCGSQWSVWFGFHLGTNDDIRARFFLKGKTKSFFQIETSKHPSILAYCIPLESSSIKLSWHNKNEPVVY